MMNSTIHGIMVDVVNGVIEPRDVKDDLDTWYEVLNCRCIDIVQRKVGKVLVDIVCDDEGLLTEHPIVSAFDKHHEPALVGNLFLCKSRQGNLISISKEEEREILSHIATAQNKNGDEWRVLVDIDF